ncbi:hypothetical protein SAMN05428934_102436 [Tessaracoccus flavus]|nr:hypothetical protein SAMN05428934_102436 [Tessaracoccus flavus]
MLTHGDRSDLPGVCVSGRGLHNLALWRHDDSAAIRQDEGQANLSEFWYIRLTAGSGDFLDQRSVIDADE